MSSKSHFFRQSIGGAFIATFRTTSNNEEIALPYLSGQSYSGVINWGDGNVSINSYDNRRHTYTEAGDYDVTVTGEVGFLNFNFGDSTSLNQIKDIKQWGENTFIKPQRFLFNSSSIEVISALDYPKYSPPFTSWDRAFCLTPNLTSIDNLDNWTPVANINLTLAFAISSINLSSVFFENCEISNLLQAFRTSSVFNTNMNNIDVSNISRIDGVFNQCTSFNQPLNNWDTSIAVNFSSIFAEATIFNQPLDNWDTSNSVTFKGTFDRAFAFNQDVSSWNVSAITVSSGLEFFMSSRSCSN